MFGWKNQNNFDLLQKNHRYMEIILALRVSKNTLDSRKQAKMTYFATFHLKMTRTKSK